MQAIFIIIIFGIPDGLCTWIPDFLTERSGSENCQCRCPPGICPIRNPLQVLLHINDLLVPGTFGYADHSTGADRYLPGANAGRDVIETCREAMVNRLNMALQAVSVWGDANPVTFNATKNQACVFSTKLSQIHLSPTFQGDY